MYSVYRKELSTEMEIVYGKVFRGKTISSEWFCSRTLVCDTISAITTISLTKMLVKWKIEKGERKNEYSLI